MDPEQGEKKELTARVLTIPGTELTLITGSTERVCDTYTVEVVVYGTDQAIHDADDRLLVGRTPLAFGSMIVDTSHAIGEKLVAGAPEFSPQADALAKQGIWLEDGRRGELLDNACLTASDILQKHIDETAGIDHAEVRSVSVRPDGMSGHWCVPTDA